MSTQSVPHRRALTSVRRVTEPVDFEEQERAAWRAIAYGHRRALHCLSVDHPAFGEFRRRFELAALVAGLRGPGQRILSVADNPSRKG